MRQLMVRVLVATTLLALPVAAHADGFLSPYIGYNFGGDTTDKSTVYGASLGFMGRKAGFEFDFGYTPEFFGADTLDVDGKLVTMTGNVMIGGRKGGFSPYFVFGGGLMRTKLTAVTGDTLLEFSDNNFGGDIGGGFFAGGKTFTVRGDFRYFRAFNFDDGLDLDIIADTLGYWRGTVGIGLMW